ncbi:MAG: hypothetical protein P9M07_03880 [Candidatus Aceula meridiana]|nr:hypothetical protein [Candidatus Aceula meridiana]
MITHLERTRQKIPTKILSIFIALSFFISSVVGPNMAYAQGVSMPTGLVMPTPAFMPVMVKAIEIDPQNPLHFGFVVDSGDTGLKGDAFIEESKKLIRYFLASLTTPEKDMWVNLSPYEKDRIIADSFGITQMGRDLLEQDYMLKQLTASLIYPEDELGKKFWKKIYKRAYDEFGTTDVPMNTFNRVWIVPKSATVYESGNRVFVVDSELEVMMEEDYNALMNNLGRKDIGIANKTEVEAKASSKISADIVREIVIPEIEKEVNSGKNFANLRQVYNAMILATWYKNNLKESLLGKVYIDQGKTKGIEIADKEANEKIYTQYLKAFKEGVYDYIKVEQDELTGKNIPRKYFSGGFISVSSNAVPFNKMVQTMTDVPVFKRKNIDATGDVGFIDVGLVENVDLEIATLPELFPTTWVGTEMPDNSIPAIGGDAKGQVLFKKNDIGLDEVEGRDAGVSASAIKLKPASSEIRNKSFGQWIKWIKMRLITNRLKDKRFFISEKLRDEVAKVVDSKDRGVIRYSEEYAKKYNVAFKEVHNFSEFRLGAGSYSDLEKDGGYIQPGTIQMIEVIERPKLDAKGTAQLDYSETFNVTVFTPGDLAAVLVKLKNNAPELYSELMISIDKAKNSEISLLSKGSGDKTGLEVISSSLKIQEILSQEILTRKGLHEVLSAIISEAEEDKSFEGNEGRGLVFIRDDDQKIGLKFLPEMDTKFGQTLFGDEMSGKYKEVKVEYKNNGTSFRLFIGAKSPFFIASSWEVSSDREEQREALKKAIQNVLGLKSSSNSKVKINKQIEKKILPQLSPKQAQQKAMELIGGLQAGALGGNFFDAEDKIAKYRFAVKDGFWKVVNAVEKPVGTQAKVYSDISISEVRADIKRMMAEATGAKNLDYLVPIPPEATLGSNWIKIKDSDIPALAVRILASYPEAIIDTPIDSNMKFSKFLDIIFDIQRLENGVAFLEISSGKLNIKEIILALTKEMDGRIDEINLNNKEILSNETENLYLKENDVLDIKWKHYEGEAMYSSSRNRVILNQESNILKIKGQDGWQTSRRITFNYDLDVDQKAVCVVRELAKASSSNSIDPNKDIKEFADGSKLVSVYNSVTDRTIHKHMYGSESFWTFEESGNHVSDSSLQIEDRAEIEEAKRKGNGSSAVVVKQDYTIQGRDTNVASKMRAAVEDGTASTIDLELDFKPLEELASSLGYTTVFKSFSEAGELTIAFLAEGKGATIKIRIAKKHPGSSVEEFLVSVKAEKEEIKKILSVIVGTFSFDEKQIAVISRTTEIPGEGKNSTTVLYSKFENGQTTHTVTNNMNGKEEWSFAESGNRVDDSISNIFARRVSPNAPFKKISSGIVEKEFSVSPTGEKQNTLMELRNVINKNPQTVAKNIAAVARLKVFEPESLGKKLFGDVLEFPFEGGGSLSVFYGKSPDNLVKITVKVNEGEEDTIDRILDATCEVLPLDKESASSSNVKTFGGINLDSALLDLQIKRDGNGIALPVAEQPFEMMNIQGFSFFIMSVTPVSSMFLLSGLPEPKEDDSNLTRANALDFVESKARFEAKEIEEVSLMKM